MELTKMIGSKKLRIVFMGTPKFAVPILDVLIELVGVRAVVTQPSRLKKDGQYISPPVKQVADKHLILVLQPEDIKENMVEILSLEPNLIITCAYGQILPKEILEYPKYGCINIHASLLPKLRGGAPIQRAIIKGFEKTGVTIMMMDQGLDSGDIIASREITISDEDNASSLHDKLSLLGRDLLLETLPDVINQTAKLTPQNREEATYALTLTAKDEKIDFHKTAREVFNQIRGLSEYPGAYCLFNDKRLKIYQARLSTNFFEEALPGEITAIYEDGIGVKTGNREIILEKVKLEGKNMMSAAEFAKGQQENIIGKLLK